MIAYIYFLIQQTRTRITGILLEPVCHRSDVGAVTGVLSDQHLHLCEASQRRNSTIAASHFDFRI